MNTNDIIFLNFKDLCKFDLFDIHASIPMRNCFYVFDNGKQCDLTDYIKKIKNIDDDSKFDITLILDVSTYGRIDFNEVPFSVKTKLDLIYGILKNFRELYVDCSGCLALRKFLVENLILSKSSIPYIFKDCCSLEQIISIDTSRLKRTSCMFENCILLETIPDLDLSSCEVSDGMFRGCRYLEKSPKLYNTENIKCISEMFYGCFNLKEVSNLNFPNVVYAVKTFMSCKNLKSINIDMQKVKFMNNIFTFCHCLKNVIINTSSELEGMASAFALCINLGTIDKLNTSNVKDMSNSFDCCENLEDLSNIDLSNVNNLYRTFYNCKNLTKFPDLYVIPEDCSCEKTFSGTVLDDGTYDA